MESAPPVQSVALDVYIMFFSLLFPTTTGIAVMVHTGDSRASGLVHAVSTQYCSIVWSQCPRCGNVEHHRPVLLSMHRDWEEFGQRVARSFICLQCFYRTRLREYRQAMFQVNQMSLFRKDLTSARGRCLNCGDKVQALQLHQNFLCRVLTAHRCSTLTTTATAAKRAAPSAAMLRGDRD